MGARAEGCGVFDTAVGAGILEQRPEHIRGEGERRNIPDLHRDPERLCTGLQHGDVLRVALVGDEKRRAGRVPEQRTTLYGQVDSERRLASLAAAPIAPIVLTPAGRHARAGSAAATAAATATSTAATA